MILVIILFTTAIFLVLGVSVWVLIKEIFTVRVPPPIRQRVKFHILHYFFQLTIALVSFGFCFVLFASSQAVFFLIGPWLLNDYLYHELSPGDFNP